MLHQRLVTSAQAQQTGAAPPASPPRQPLQGWAKADATARRTGLARPPFGKSLKHEGYNRARNSTLSPKTDKHQAEVTQLVKGRLYWSLPPAVTPVGLVQSALDNGSWNRHIGQPRRRFDWDEPGPQGGRITNRYVPTAPVG
jgi:hypothetical protein